jgi:hypothetical protein
MADAAPARRPILTLDLATTTGWCIGVLGSPPVYGSVLLIGASRAARYAALLDWLDAAAAVHGVPSDIIVEAAVIHGAGQDRARLALGLLAHIELWGWDQGCRVLDEMPATTRKEMLGRGSFPAGTAKSHVMAWCREHGYRPGDDNAADALLLWCRVQAVRLGRAE